MSDIQPSPAPVQQVSIQDVLLVLGQKEIELQYARARIAQAEQAIIELRAELAKHQEGH